MNLLDWFVPTKYCLTLILWIDNYTTCAFKTHLKSKTISRVPTFKYLKALT